MNLGSLSPFLQGDEKVQGGISRYSATNLPVIPGAFEPIFYREMKKVQGGIFS